MLTNPGQAILAEDAVQGPGNFCPDPHARGYPALGVMVDADGVWYQYHTYAAITE